MLLTLLRAVRSNYVPPAGAVYPAIDMMAAPVVDPVNEMDVTTFFSRLATFMGPNPASWADAPTLRQMATTGIRRANRSTRASPVIPEAPVVGVLAAPLTNRVR